jgi:hypothetical protein
MSIWRSLPLLVVLGCGGGSKPPAEEPSKPAEPAADAAPRKDHSCAEAQANVALFTANVSRVVAATVGTRCAEDGWAQEVINCFAATQDGPQLSLCTALLTPEQQRKFEQQGVPDAIDPNAAPDPACQVFAGGEPPHTPPWRPSDAAQPAPPAPAQPAPVPGLGLPRPGADGKGAAPAPAAEPTQETLRTIAPKQLEQLRAAGETQLAPNGAEQRLMVRCRVDRVAASFKLCIDNQGAPIWIETLKSSRLEEYDYKLITAITKWRYQPYVVEGKATAVCSAVTFVYTAK